MRSNFTRLVVAVFAIALFAAACGDDGEAGSDAAPTATESTTTVPAPTTVAETTTTTVAPDPLRLNDMQVLG